MKIQNFYNRLKINILIKHITSWFLSDKPPCYFFLKFNPCTVIKKYVCNCQEKVLHSQSLNLLKDSCCKRENFNNLFKRPNNNRARKIEGKDMSCMGKWAMK